MIGSFLRGILPPQAVNGLILTKDELRGWLRAKWYAGSKYECTCCGHTFRTFTSGKASLRRYLQCPRCDSRERQRAMVMYLRANTTIFSKGGRLLHVAPERGLKSLFSKVPNLDYYGVDLGSWLADVRMDVTDLLFRDGTFDMVICSHVLEHVPDDRKAMAELCRVLKPEGVAILLVPIRMEQDKTDEDFSVTDPAERLRRFGQDDHVRIYGKDFVTRLEESGFVIEQVNFSEDASAADFERYGLMKSDIIFVGRRKS